MTGPATAHSDVLVVGAGIGGLATADRLVRAGRQVTVLEARDRVGGRLLSEPGPGAATDLGATWWWPGEHRVAELIARFAVPTSPQHLAGDTLLEETGGVQRLTGNLLDRPAGRYLTGADCLPRQLAAGLPPGTVHLGEPVVGVELTGNTVAVTSSRGVRTADHVVLALPPSLVPARITITPALDGDLHALAAATPVWMGQVAKVMTTFDTPFWRAAGLAGAAISRRGPLQEIHDVSGTDGHPATLLGFAAPPRDGDDLATAALAQLIRLFGPRAAAGTVSVLDWSREPWTSPPGPATSTRYDLYGHPLYARPALGGRLHWAATETADGHGHVEGALAAAERAAAAIISSHARPTDPDLLEQR